MERGIRRTYTWFYLPDDVFSNLTSKPMNRPVKFFLHNVNAATHAGNCNLFLRSSEPGGARRDRTDDLMLAKHALYQLSYGPLKDRQALQSLSPIRLPKAPRSRWWAQADSNCRPHAYQACALTN